MKEPISIFNKIRNTITKSLMRKILFKIPVIKSLEKKGYLNKQNRRLILLYYFFKFFFGLNRECKFPVHFTTTIIEPNNIKMGYNVEKSFLLSGNCYFQAINGIEIGDNTIFAPGVKIISANHSIKNYNEHVKERPIVIGKNCWIGANVIILSGVHLGDYTIVAAGAVVTKSFEKGNCILAGTPAKIIKEL